MTMTTVEFASCLAKSKVYKEFILAKGFPKPHAVSNLRNHNDAKFVSKL